MQRREKSGGGYELPPGLEQLRIVTALGRPRQQVHIPGPGEVEGVAACACQLLRIRHGHLRPAIRTSQPPLHPFHCLDCLQFFAFQQEEPPILHLHLVSLGRQWRRVDTPNAKNHRQICL